MVHWSDLDVPSSLVFSCRRSLFDSGQCNSYSIPQCMLKSLIVLNMQSFISNLNESRNRTQNISRVLLDVKDKIKIF